MWQLTEKYVLSHNRNIKHNRVHIRNTSVFYGRIYAILFVWLITFSLYLMALSMVRNVTPHILSAWEKSELCAPNERKNILPWSVFVVELQCLLSSLKLKAPLILGVPAFFFIFFLFFFLGGEGAGIYQIGNVRFTLVYFEVVVFAFAFILWCAHLGKPYHAELIYQL